jgi:thiamine-monophosphate kinase
MSEITQPQITGQLSPVTAVSEFDIIARHFTRPTPQANLGVGDDAALLAVGAGMELAVSTDMLVAGTHFFPDTDPEKLGWKTLAVNISDLAAMGADPRWATLALALPEVNEPWLSAFSQGFFDCAQRFGVDLIGGDTTRGPLTLSVQIMGEVPRGSALRRDGAKIGDDIWISGQLGNASLALAALQGKIPMAGLEPCLPALHSPQPRVTLGLGLRGHARAAIDISDGLVADLGHILQRSNCGAEIKLNLIPRSSHLAGLMSQPLGLHCLLAGGDDYELCFTAPENQESYIESLRDKLNIRLTRIGKITAGRELRVLDMQGKPVSFEGSGYDHFMQSPSRSNTASPSPPVGEGRGEGL